MKRIHHEPAFVLHRYDWSESSLILEVFTRHHGRVALVAKGVKRPSSQFRPILLPLQPLTITYSGDAEVQTLKGAEWQGGQTMPVGEALLAGYYVNELLLKLLARDDPHERLFDAYAQTVIALRGPQQMDAALRAFELVLLREIGLLPSLNAVSASAVPPEEGLRYAMAPEMGLREVSDNSSQAALSALQWSNLQSALESPAPIVDLRQTVLAMPAAERGALKLQLRQLLNAQVGGQGLRTRALMRDVQMLGLRT